MKTVRLALFLITVPPALSMAATGCGSRTDIGAFDLPGMSDDDAGGGGGTAGGGFGGTAEAASGRTCLLYTSPSPRD